MSGEEIKPDEACAETDLPEVNNRTGETVIETLEDLQRYLGGQALDAANQPEVEGVTYGNK